MIEYGVIETFGVFIKRYQMRNLNTKVSNGLILMIYDILLDISGYVDKTDKLQNVDNLSPSLSICDPKDCGPQERMARQ